MASPMKVTQSGHEVVPVEGEEKEKMNQDWKISFKTLDRYNPGRWLLPSNYRRFGDKIYNFKFRSSDVVVMTWPKCGTTVTQEMVWAMTNNPNLDRSDADTFLFTRSPYIEFDTFGPPIEGPLPKGNPVYDRFHELCPGQDPNEGICMQTLEVLPDPRVIKTHLPLPLMPSSLLDTCRVVYVTRNPKDVVVSAHHHFAYNNVAYGGTFEDFVQYYVDDSVPYAPYWLHVKEAWEKRHHPNMHFMFFEDLKTNQLEEIRKLNSFLQTNLSEIQLQNIAKHTSFSEMKSRYLKLNLKDDLLGFFTTEGGFFRKGQAGNWKCHLTPALESKLDDWIKKNFNFGIDFKYEVSSK